MHDNRRWASRAWQAIVVATTVGAAIGWIQWALSGGGAIIAGLEFDANGRFLLHLVGSCIVLTIVILVFGFPVWDRVKPKRLRFYAMEQEIRELSAKTAPDDLMLTRQVAGLLAELMFLRHNLERLGIASPDPADFTKWHKFLPALGVCCEHRDYQAAKDIASGVK